jgi:hypothetical protein
LKKLLSPNTFFSFGLSWKPDATKESTVSFYQTFSPAVYLKAAQYGYLSAEEPSCKKYVCRFVSSPGLLLYAQFRPLSI